LKNQKMTAVGGGVGKVSSSGKKFPNTHWATPHRKGEEVMIPCEGGEAFFLPERNRMDQLLLVKTPFINEREVSLSTQRGKTRISYLKKISSLKEGRRKGEGEKGRLSFTECGFGNSQYTGA